MLETQAGHELIERLWDQLVDRAELPGNEAEFFAVEGVVKSQFDDRRRFVRRQLRERVILTVDGISTGAFTVDEARDGFRIISCKQLFPLDEARVLLPSGERVMVTVRWCRRLDERCYSVGCQRVMDS